jgi:hypothetical protein
MCVYACVNVCVGVCVLCSYPTLTYTHSFSSFFPFLVIQARAVSGNTSTASEEVCNVRVGERRIKEEDSSTIALSAMLCILSFLPIWSPSLLIHSTPFLPFYLHHFLPLRQPPSTLCSYFTSSPFPIPYPLPPYFHLSIHSVNPLRPSPIVSPLLVSPLFPPLFPLIISPLCLPLSLSPSFRTAA